MCVAAGPTACQLQSLLRCSASGQFEEVQCESSRGQCWCVDQDGMELYGTRQNGRPARCTYLYCWSEYTFVTIKLNVKPCKGASSVAVTEDQEKMNLGCPGSCEVRTRRLLHTSMSPPPPPPQCDEGGSFLPVQCKFINTTNRAELDLLHAFNRFPEAFETFSSFRKFFPLLSSYCFCSDSRGREMENTGMELLLSEVYDSAFSGLRSGRSFAQTNIYRVLQRRMLGVRLALTGHFRCPSPCEEERRAAMAASSVFVPSCESDGSFTSTQCQQGGQCWCVDPTGRELPGTRQFGDSLVCSGPVDCLSQRRLALSRLFSGPVEPPLQTSSDRSPASCLSLLRPLRNILPAEMDPTSFLSSLVQVLHGLLPSVGGALQALTRSSPQRLQENLFGGKFLKSAAAFNFSGSVGAQGALGLGQLSSQTTVLQKNRDLVQSVSRALEDATFLSALQNTLMGLSSSQSASLQQVLTPLLRSCSGDQEGEGSIFVPSCTSSGGFQDIQCGGAECWCVDSQGQEVTGSRTAGRRPRCPTHCEKARELALRVRSNMAAGAEIHIPACSEDGNFLPLQCVGSRCFCVDAEGKTMIGGPTGGAVTCKMFSRLSSEKMTQNLQSSAGRCSQALAEVTAFRQEVKNIIALSNSSHLPLGYGFLLAEGLRLTSEELQISQSEEELRLSDRLLSRSKAALRLAAFSSESQLHIDYSFTSSSCSSSSAVQMLLPPRRRTYQMFTPQCDADGRWMVTQCYHSTGQCWCVDEDGEYIPDSLTSRSSFVSVFTVVCPAGSFSREGACLLCPQGTYQDEEGRDFCNRCPSGSSPAGASSVDLCDEGRGFGSAGHQEERYCYHGNQVPDLSVFRSVYLCVYLCVYLRVSGMEFSSRQRQQSFVRMRMMKALSGVFRTQVFSSRRSSLSDVHRFCQDGCSRDACCDGFILNQNALDGGTLLCGWLRAPSVLMCGEQDWDVIGQGVASRMCGAGLTYKKEQGNFVFDFGGQKFTISGSEVVCLALISLGVQTCSDADSTSWMTQDCRPSAVKTSPEPFGWYQKPVNQWSSSPALCPPFNLPPTKNNVSMDEWRLLSDSSVAIDPSLATYDVIHVSRDIATNRDKTRDWCLHACHQAESCAAVSLREAESATRCVLYPDTTACGLSSAPALSLTCIFVSSERLPSVTSVSIPGHGILRGIAMETALGSDRRTVVQFLGVPYARPPIGSLRFEAAQPADWLGTWDATKPRSSCVQPGDVESAASSEDCLYLNIFTPAALVILVFFFNPSANQSPGLLDGSVLAAVGNIIVVTASYRTAALGFLSTGASGLRGNYGLSDQEAVLRWVHAHISLVGGDNTRVTVGAERGGADITSLHLLSSSPPLFQRMMLMGGSVFSPVLIQTPSTSRRQAIDLAAELGCPTSDDDKMASCLRAVPMQQLNTAQTKLLAVRGPFQSWSPVRQSVSQPASFHRVDLLLGTSEHDGLISRARRIKDFEVLQGRADGKTAFYEALSRSLGGASGNPLLKEAATWFYSLDHSPSAAGYNLFSRALNNATRDLFIICPTLQMASHWAKSNANVFLFHQPDSSAHSRADVSVPLDVQFVFGAPHHPLSSQRFSSSDRRLSLAVMSYASSFIQSGSDSKPRSSSALGGFHTVPPTYLELSPALQHQEGLSQNACSFWRQLGTRLTSSTGERVLLDQNISVFKYPVYHFSSN
uniref:Thyroglobulin n=1 Tax=Amphiprion ocellaris TaxID=80972 RepID=A0A3Q1DGV2_AMPOC